VFNVLYIQNILTIIGKSSFCRLFVKLTRAQDQQNCA